MCTYLCLYSLVTILTIAVNDSCPHKWDADYIDKIGDTRQQLYDLILAANYMDIKSLLHLGCAKVASLIKGQPLEKIKEILDPNQGAKKAADGSKDSKDGKADAKPGKEDTKVKDDVKKEDKSRGTTPATAVAAPSTSAATATASSNKRAKKAASSSSSATTAAMDS